MTDKKQGLMKDGTRRRTPATKGGRGGGMPRIMWLAIVACIAGAVYLFGNQNGDVPTGIGENQTVVTAPDVESNLGHDEGPRSGDVDITEQANALTPEASDEPAKTQPAKTKTTKTKTVVTNPPPVRKITKEAPPALVPAATGPYAAQTGSFGQADNADKEAARLQKLGWNARVKVGNTSNGSFVYRVHIGYFKSRGEAENFIRQNRKQMTGAIAVHR